MHARQQDRVVFRPITHPRSGPMCHNPARTIARAQSHLEARTKANFAGDVLEPVVVACQRVELGKQSDLWRQVRQAADIFVCVARDAQCASFCRARFSRAGTSPRRLTLDQSDPARTGDPLVVLQVQNREVREQPNLLWHYLRTFGARALRHALRRTRPRCALVQRG